MKVPGGGGGEGRCAPEEGMARPQEESRRRAQEQGQKGMGRRVKGRRKSEVVFRPEEMMPGIRGKHREGCQGLPAGSLEERTRPPVP